MAIKLKDAKKWTRVSGGFFNLIRPEFFGMNEKGKPNHRRYFPIELSDKDRKTLLANSDTYKEVSWNLEDNGYEIVSYEEGYAVKRKSNNIFCNMVSKETNNINLLKIGRLLVKLNLKDLGERFKTDPIRVLNKFSVVVSRHPIDIAGMSTGREWTSCMSEGGCNHNFVKNDIHGGTIIAYLISNNDKNIRNPLSRILFKKYESDNGHSYYALANKTYGIHGNILKKECKRIEEELNKNCPQAEYKFNDNYFYNDGEPSTIDTRSEELKKKEQERKFNLKIRKIKDHNKKVTGLMDSLFEMCGNLTLDMICDSPKWFRILSTSMTGEKLEKFKPIHQLYKSSKGEQIDGFYGCSFDYYKYIIDKIESTSYSDIDKQYAITRYLDECNFGTGLFFPDIINYSYGKICSRYLLNYTGSVYVDTSVKENPKLDDMLTVLSNCMKDCYELDNTKIEIVDSSFQSFRYLVCRNTKFEVAILKYLEPVTLQYVISNYIRNINNLFNDGSVLTKIITSIYSARIENGFTVEDKSGYLVVDPLINLDEWDK